MLVNIVLMPTLLLLSRNILVERDTMTPPPSFFMPVCIYSQTQHELHTPDRKYLYKCKDEHSLFADQQHDPRGDRQKASRRLYNPYATAVSHDLQGQVVDEESPTRRKPRSHV